MKTLAPLCCVLSLLIFQSVANAEGLYKWTDARGNTQYGDQPPANVNAKPMELPKITIIDNYAEQWKPLKFDQEPVLDEPVKAKTPKSTYINLDFLAPKQDQAIRANNGDVSAMVSIKPPLKKGHQIVFSIDGKPMEKGKSRTKNFSNLNRGSHTIGVKVVDRKGKTLKSNSVVFNVLRASRLNKAQSNKATTLAQATKAPQSIQQQTNQNDR